MFTLMKLSFKAFNVWDSFFAYCTSKFIIPIINIIIFYSIGVLTNNNSSSFALRSVLIIMLNTIITDSIIFIQSEKRFNTLTPILITPINNIKLYFSRVVINYFHGLILTVVYFIIVSMVFSITLSYSELFYSIMHILGLSIPILVLSIFVGFIAILVEEVTVLTILLYNGLLITSGLFHNINILYLQWLTPIKEYTKRIDSIIAGNPVVFSDYLVYFVYSAIYLAILFLFVGKIEKLIYKQGAKEV